MAFYNPGVQPLVQKLKEVQAEQAAAMDVVQRRPRAEGELPVLLPEDSKLIDTLQVKIDLLVELIELYNLDKK